MLVVRHDEAAAKKFAEDNKLPLFLEPGNPFSPPQGALIRIPPEREKSVALQSGAARGVALRSLDQPLGEILGYQIDRTLFDLSAHPDNPFQLNNVGVAYLNAGKFESAAYYFRRALELDSQQFTANLNLAKVFFLTGRLTEALDVYKKLAEVQSQNPVVLMNMAQVYIQRNDLGRAHDLLGSVLAINPENSAAYNNRAVVRLLLGRPHEAIADLRSALRLNVRDAAVHNNLGGCYVLLKSPRKAIQAFKAALTLDPLDTGAIKNLATLYISQRGYDSAIGLLTQEFDRLKEDIDGCVLLARVYFLSGKYPQSIYHLSAALRLATAKEAIQEIGSILNNLGVVFHAQGNVDRAREHFDRCLSMSPDTPTPFRNLAALLFDQQLFDQARGVLERCLSLFPKDPVALALMGDYYALNGEYTVAVQYLEQAIAADPKRPAPYGWLTTIIGEVYGNFHAAITRLEEGLRYNPKSIILLNNLAYMHLMLGNTREARQILDRIDHKDYDAYLTATRGLLLLKEGNVREGTHLYDRASGLAKTKDLRSLVLQKKNLELARYFLNRGDKETARRLLQAAVSVRTMESLFHHQVLSLRHAIESGGT